MHDKEGTKRVLGGIKFRIPRLSTISGEGGYEFERRTRNHKSFTKHQYKALIVDIKASSMGSLNPYDPFS